MSNEEIKQQIIKYIKSKCEEYSFEYRDVILGYEFKEQLHSDVSTYWIIIPEDFFDQNKKKKNIKCMTQLTDDLVRVGINYTIRYAEPICSIDALREREIIFKADEERLCKD